MHMYLPNFLYFLSDSENGNELQTDKLKTWALVYKQLQVYIGASLSKPHTKAAITKSEYLCIIPGSWDPCTPWNTLCIPVYWCAHMHNCQDNTTEQQGLGRYSLSDYQWRLKIDDAHMHIIKGSKLLRQCGAVVARQLATVPMWNDRCWADCTRSYQNGSDTELQYMYLCVSCLMLSHTMVTSLALLAHIVDLCKIYAKYWAIVTI